MTSYWPTSSITEQFPIDLRLDAVLVGDAPVMRRLKQAISIIAPSDVPVLINGPTGAGKEVVANAMHLMSGRTGPMIPVNCGAIPADLLESELFGHEKGSFTGATAQRIGLIEQAEGGTLFLDEIGETPLHVQVKLLRALETQTIQRVGGGAPIPVNFRLLSATHRDLQQDVAQKRFREDLLFRIEVFSLSVPALCEHAEDIPQILRTMEQGSRGGSTLQLTPCALALLMSQDWPGNVRELRNFHDRAQILFRNRTITAAEARIAMAPRLSFAGTGGRGAAGRGDRSQRDAGRQRIAGPAHHVAAGRGQGDPIGTGTERRARHPRSGNAAAQADHAHQPYAEVGP